MSCDWRRKGSGRGLSFGGCGTNTEAGSGRDTYVEFSAGSVLNNILQRRLRLVVLFCHAEF